MAAFSYGITISHKLRQVEAVEKVVVISKFHPCFLQHVTAVIAHSRKSWNLTAKSKMHLRFHFMRLCLYKPAFGVSPTSYSTSILSVCCVEPLLELLLHCNGGFEGCIVDSSIPLPSNLYTTFLKRKSSLF